MTTATVDSGKGLMYDKFCVECHGANREGRRRRGGQRRLSAPSRLRRRSTEGPSQKARCSIPSPIGRNIAMGSHASQLDHHERWLVIEYVKYLQHDGKMPGEATAAATTDSTATAPAAQ
jgi:mono/diheme cytochrome c family protein